MIIQFKKEKHKANTFKCLRKDNTQTWAKLNPSIEIHDLAHYVVETELEFKNAFYGLIARGYNIQDFELPANKRPTALIPKNLHEEALQTEHIVNLLQIHFQEKSDSLNILSSLQDILLQNNLAFPKALTLKKLERIILKLNHLYKKWVDLEEGETLELNFINKPE